MERTQAWLLVVVAASLGAGIAAFALATPDQSTRIARDELGFRTLDRRSVGAALEGAGEHHRRLHRTAALERAAGAAVRRWLVAMPVGGQRPRRGSALPVHAGDGPEALARVTGFAAWLDGVPASSTRIELGATVPLDQQRAWAVDAVVHVELWQARDGVRRLRHPLVVEVAAPTRAGARWRILDTHVEAPRRWLRGYADPVVARGAALHVVGPGSAATDVVRGLELADGFLRALRGRAASLRGSGRATIWFVPDRVRGGVFLGAPARTAPAGHDIAWVDPRGEVVVALDRWHGSPPAVRERALRHAVAHVALLDGTPRSPRILLEAVAEAEAGTDAPPLGGPMAAALEPAASGRPIAELLVARASSPLADPAERLRARALGAWIADVHGTAVGIELLLRIEGGLDPDAAVRRLLRATPGGVEQRVRTWAAGPPQEEAAAGAREPRGLQPPDTHPEVPS